MQQQEAIFFCKKNAIYERNPVMRAQPLVILMGIGRIKLSVLCKMEGKLIWRKYL